MASALAHSQPFSASTKEVTSYRLLFYALICIVRPCRVPSTLHGVFLTSHLAFLPRRAWNPSWSSRCRWDLTIWEP